MSENKMFCFQCQETAKGTGCTVRGVCGKLPETSKWMDLLLSVVRGIGTIQHCMNKAEIKTEQRIGDYLVDALFSTITNANFDDQSILNRVDKGIALKRELLKKAKDHNIALPDYQEVKWGGEKEDYDAEGRRETVLRNSDADLRSLKELIVLGLKGMAAYYEHAARLGQRNEEIIDFLCQALFVVSNPDADLQDLLSTVLETGNYGTEVMALLDKANTTAYGNPEVTEVNIGVGKNPGILISGHDLHDIESLLEQTEGTGIDVYTHGEMLPAHYYPKLKKYKPLVGNSLNSMVPLSSRRIASCLLFLTLITKIVSLPQTRQDTPDGNISRQMPMERRTSHPSLPWQRPVKPQRKSRRAISLAVSPILRYWRLPTRL